MRRRSTKFLGVFRRLPELFCALLDADLLLRLDFVLAGVAGSDSIC